MTGGDSSVQVNPGAWLALGAAVAGGAGLRGLGSSGHVLHRLGLLDAAPRGPEKTTNHGTLVGSPNRDLELGYARRGSARFTEWNKLVQRVTARVAASEELIRRAEVTMSASEELCELTEELAEGIEAVRRQYDAIERRARTVSRRANRQLDAEAPSLFDGRVSLGSC